MAENENNTPPPSVTFVSQDDSGSMKFSGSRRNLKSASFLAAQEEKIRNGEIAEAEQTFKECVILVKKCLRTDMNLALEKYKLRDEIIQEIMENQKDSEQDPSNGNNENSNGSENASSKSSPAYMQDPRIIQIDAQLEEDSEVHLYLANCYMALGNIYKQWRKYDEAQNYYEMSRDHYKLGFVNWGTDMKPRIPKTKSESNVRTRTLRMVDQILSDVNAPCVEQETEFFKRRTQMYKPGEIDTIEVPGNRMSQGTQRLVKKFQRGSVQLGQGSFKESGERPQTIFSAMPPKLSEEASSSSSDLSGQRRSAIRPSATMNRMSVINEMMTTERDYVADLEIVVKLWLNPIRVRDLLTEAEIGAIFSNLETILQMNQTILLAFEKRLIVQRDKQEGTEMVGDIFQQMGDFFKMYKVYCADHLRALQKLEELTQSKSAFAQFLEEAKQDPRCRKLGLYGFLIKPVQRITKYPLLLRELVRNTPSSHPDYQKLVDARNKIESIVNQINEATRSFENQQKILAIQNNVEGLTNLVAPARFLVLGGTIHYQAQRSEKPIECTVYLFNDLILICKKNIINLKLISNKEYSLLHQIPLINDTETSADPYADSKPRVMLWADDETLKNAFQIRAQGKDYIFTCPTSDECAKWYNAAKKAIRELHDKFIRRVSTGGLVHSASTPPGTPPTTPVRHFSSPSTTSMTSPTSPAPVVEEQAISSSPASKEPSLLTPSASNEEVESTNQTENPETPQTEQTQTEENN